jgi:hypothetical protein
MFEEYRGVEDCIGSSVGRSRERDWWHATGRAREDFRAYGKELLEQLQAGFRDTYCSIVHFHLFMIGRDRASAKPTVMFFCEEK